MSLTKKRDKGEVLRIRCSKTLKKEFINFQIDYSLKTYDQALANLLELAKKYPEDGTLKHVRWG